MSTDSTPEKDLANLDLNLPNLDIAKEVEELKQAMQNTYPELLAAVEGLGSAFNGFSLGATQAIEKLNIQGLINPDEIRLPKILDANERLIGLAKPTWPTIKSHWVLCDHLDIIDGSPMIYPVNGDQQGDSGFLFLDTSHKYPMGLKPRQVKSIRKWLKKAHTGYVIGIDLQDNVRVFEHRLTEAVTIREHKPYDETAALESLSD